MKLIALILFLSAGCATTAAKHAEADAEYTNEAARCVDASPTLAPDASTADRAKAWADYDTCVVTLHARWAKDGGK